MGVSIVKNFKVPTVALISILFGAFAVTSCGPMNAQPAGGLGAATVDTADAAKDFSSANKEYLIGTKFLGTLDDGQLPAGDSKIQIRVLHNAADLSSLANTETVSVQYFHSHPGPTINNPPNQGALTAVLTPQQDGSTIATLHFSKSPKTVTVVITITNSTDASLSDKKYVYYGQVNN
jgi:hypothetical protein